LSTRLITLCFDANEPLRLARFWAAALSWDIDDESDEEISLVPTDGTRFRLVFLPVPEPKSEKNRIHLDLVSESREHQAEMVDRLTSLGAQRIDVGQGSDAEHVVLGDPEGNELCVVLRGEFLATTGLIGAIVFEPADHPVVGRFWSEATGWPIVYDRDGDIAIRDRLGNWTYQFVASVDDYVQDIDLVIRGEDLIASTGLQIAMARLMGRRTPATFAHHELVMKSPTQKLSKSDGDTGVRDLRAAGWTPARVIGEAARAVGLVEAGRDLEAREVETLFARWQDGGVPSLG